jgi:hypothetical protein
LGRKEGRKEEWTRDVREMRERREMREMREMTLTREAGEKGG